MKEESKKITLPLGKVSWEKELGCYYIDMRPAKVHYTSNIYDGKFDQEGVPMIGTGDGTYGYFPINVAQYGFMLHADYLENPDPTTLEILKSCLSVLEKLKTEEKGHVVWWHHHFERKYKIQPPWASAMAQGEVISFYLRMYQLLSDPSLLETAQKAYRFLQMEGTEKAVRRRDEFGNLWFEEYPSEPPSYVLNGFIYTIFGLMDLYRVTNDESVKADIDECVITLQNRLKEFDAGYWSVYDLQKKELVRWYYQQNVHVPQLEILAQLFEEHSFLKLAESWKSQLTTANFAFVQLMYRVQPRWRKIKRLLNV